MISLCSVIFLLLLKYCWADLFSGGPWQLLLLIPTWTDEHIAEQNCPFEGLDCGHAACVEGLGLGIRRLISVGDDGEIGDMVFGAGWGEEDAGAEDVAQ